MSFVVNCYLTTFPPFITNVTRLQLRDVRQRIAATAMMSANRPGLK